MAFQVGHLEAPRRPRLEAMQQPRCIRRKTRAAAAPTSKACGPVWESSVSRALGRAQALTYCDTKPPSISVSPSLKWGKI